MLSSTDRNNPVRHELSLHQLHRDRLLAQFPDLDDETLADTLEGITDLREILAALIRSALVDEAMAVGLSTRLADMKARLERFSERAKTKRSVVLEAMNQAEIKTLVEPDFTASTRAGGFTLEVIGEDQIPEVYWKPQPPKLDRSGLLAAVKGGLEVEGVALAPRQMQLSVRTK